MEIMIKREVSNGDIMDRNILDWNGFEMYTCEWLGDKIRTNTCDVIQGFFSLVTYSEEHGKIKGLEISVTKHENNFLERNKKKKY